MNYQLFFEQSPGLFLVLDPSFQIVAVTDAYANATMTDREVIIGKALFDVFPDNPQDSEADGVSNLRQSIEKVIRFKKMDQMAIQKYDIRQPNGNYEERFWSPTNTPILDTFGNVTHVIHAVEDVTSLIRSKELESLQKEKNLSLNELNKNMSQEIYERIRQLDQANLKLKTVNESLKEKAKLLELSNEDLALFAETASHDIKAPFRTIGGYLNIISEKIKHTDDKEVIKSLASISSARKRITILLDDLLNFARITRSTDVKARIEINEVLKEVIEILDFNIREKKATINYPDNIPPVKGIKTQIFQVIQNLLANAIKFNTVDPIVNITFKTTESYIEFSIQDNGIGIDSTYYEKIFSPFERLHRSDQYQGTGLGLTICKQMVERNGGRIWITSDKSIGSVFYFTLPKF